MSKKLILSVLNFLGFYRYEHEVRVLDYVKTAHPEWTRISGWTIADEVARYVVIVYYEVPPTISFPQDAKIFAVGKADNKVEELEVDLGSPYGFWIYNRK